MSAHLFQIALTGLKDGHAADEVAPRLAKMFKQPQEKMLAILDGRQRVLKKGLSREDALKYEAALAGAGCTCVVTADTVAADTVAAAATASQAAPQPAAQQDAQLEPQPAAEPSAAELAAAALRKSAAEAGSSGRNFYAKTEPARAQADAGAAEDDRDRQSRLALYQLGAGQKLVIASIILNGAVLGAQKLLGPLPSLVASLAVLAVMISGLLAMCRGLDYRGIKRAGLFVLMLIPLVSLVTLVILSMKASKAFKEEGIRVGLTGVSSDDLQTIAAQAGLPAGTRPRVGMASVAVLLVLGGCLAISSRYRAQAQLEEALEMSQPCELAGVWDISSRLGDFTLTLDENGKMQTSEPKHGDWRFESGELLLTENNATTHYKILRDNEGYVLERMGVVHTMQPKQPLAGKRCRV